MPRKKVPPHARRRVVQACQHCKTSKRKCSASWPCNHCVKRGLTSTCDAPHLGTATNVPSIARSITENHSVHSDTHNVDADTQSAANALPPRSPTPVNQDGGHVGEDHESHQGSPSSPDATRANMLSDSAGEYVFVGRSASLSFLQLIREIVARCIGPSDFSEHSSRDQMLEVQLYVEDNASNEIVLDLQQQQHYIEYYFLATTGLIDVVSLEEAKELLNHTHHSSSNARAIRLLLVAIGSQAGPIVNTREHAVGRHAFSLARTIMFSSMLENPSLDMIRSFLLLSFYMLGACHRNAAYLYLGIAARAAHTLGIHTTESYAMLSEDRRHVQLKCWKSLVTLDLMTSSVLGRTTAILAQRSSTNTVVKLTERLQTQSLSKLEAVYRLALLVDSISNQFNGPQPVAIKAAQLHLKSLKNWSDMLPAQLRPSTIPSDQSVQTRQSLLGCMHISCFYYFTVMLVTRPFLIVNITRQLFPKKDQLYQASISNRNDAEELASACLNAAIYMAQTCSDLLDLNMLVETMCLLQAWILPAGLVLGFQMFADCGRQNNVEHAFTSCRRVLQHLATRSPLALQYYEILTLLSSAIDRHRQIRMSRESSNAGSLVARIMDLHPMHGPQEPPISTGNDTTGNLAGSVDLIQPLPFNDVLNHGADIFSTGTDNFMGLEELPFPSPESFMFDLQSFGMMPWDIS